MVAVLCLSLTGGIDVEGCDVMLAMELAIDLAPLQLAWMQCLQGESKLDTNETNIVI